MADQVLYQSGRIYIVPETNYAGGPAGLAKSKTKIATTDTPITILPMKEGSTISLPILKNERIQIGGVLTSGYARHRLVNKVVSVQGKTEHYLGSTEFNIMKGSVLDEGKLPSHSWVMQFDDGKTRYEMYGCFIESMDLSIGEEEAPDMSLSWRSYAFVLNGNDLKSLDHEFGDGQPLLRENVSLSIDGVNVPFKSINLSLKNNFNEIQTANGREFWIQNNELELEITTIFPDTSQFNALLGSTVSQKPVVITLGSLGSITITNLELYVDAVESVGAMKSEFREVSLKGDSTVITKVTID